MGEPLDYRRPRRGPPPHRGLSLARIGLALGLCVPCMLAALPHASRGLVREALLIASGSFWVASIVLATLAHGQGDDRSRRVAALAIVVAFLALPAAFVLYQIAAPFLR